MAPTVERLWPGETVVIVATGPSLTATNDSQQSDDVDFCRGKARVIVVNDAYRYALWADALYACDSKWHGWANRNQGGKHPNYKQFTGLKFGMKPYPGVLTLRDTGKHGLERDPSGLRTGYHSGFQAIGLAVHLGAARICLLGFDMKPGKRVHAFGVHPDRSQPPYNACLKAYPTIVQPLKELGIGIVNCTPGSAIDCFPMGRIQDVLQPLPELQGAAT